MEKQNKLKIWTRKEIYKGYIPYDKIRYKGISFEDYSLSNFDKKYLEHNKIKRMVKTFRTENMIEDLINYYLLIILLQT